MFSANCTTKIVSGITFSFVKPSFKNINADKAIRIYKIGQTIENTYAGGDKKGLFKY